jgi:four helix bundle protein
MKGSSHHTALELILSAISPVRRIVAKIRPLDRHLADQLRRAVTSVALNLAEADGSRDGNRRVRLETAHGSASEAKYALRIAVAWGYVTQDEIEEAFSSIDRVGAMTWRRLQNR